MPFMLDSSSIYVIDVDYMLRRAFALHTPTVSIPRICYSTTAPPSTIPPHFSTTPLTLLAT
ncbi:hypothetical protein K440DRAFT_169037 [Wilcoxina mikolae CBS 423.85]|nr:hypothetical protein K440DRAFT_169037 [Wilcoxina mikolae CBS 423.85]